MDAADLLNGGISYAEGQPSPQLISAASFVGASPLPSGASFEVLGQMPGTITALESLPATIEGSFFSWEAILGQFSRVAPAGAR
jgi:hypothetical protein